MADGVYRPEYSIHPRRSGLILRAISPIDTSVRRRISKSRIVSLMDFRAEGLTAGAKLQNSFPLRLFSAFRSYR